MSRSLGFCPRGEEGPREEASGQGCSSSVGRPQKAPQLRCTACPSPQNEQRWDSTSFRLTIRAGSGQGAQHSQGRSSEPAWPWHSPTFAREAGQLWPTLEGPIGVDSAEIWQLLYVHGLGPPRERQAPSVMLSREQRMLLAVMGWVPGASLVHRAIH